MCTYQQLNLFLLLSYLSISGFKREEVWQASYSWNALSKPWAREVKSINRNNHRYSSWEPDCWLLFLALPMTQLVTLESHFTPPFSSFLTGTITHPTRHPRQGDPVASRWVFLQKKPRPTPSASPRPFHHAGSGRGASLPEGSWQLYPSAFCEGKAL